MPVEDEKEVVAVMVFVPDELAFELDQSYIVLIELGDDLRLPVIVEERQFLDQIDLVQDGLLGARWSLVGCTGFVSQRCVELGWAGRLSSHVYGYGEPGWQNALRSPPRT
jgi:hypothetical protein